MEREVFPVTISSKKGSVIVDKDEEALTVIDAKKLRGLTPAFQKTGTVTAANSSKPSDGAAVLLLLSGAEVRKRGLESKVLFCIRGYADVCKEPVQFTTAPADCIVKAIDHVNSNSSKKLSLKDIEYHEINEAFSVVALANAK